MEFDHFILICMFIIIIIIFYKITANKPLYEGLATTSPTITTAPTEAISNIASLYNNAEMTVTNANITQNLTVAGTATIGGITDISGNVNIGGSTVAKDVTLSSLKTPAGSVDLAPSDTTHNANGLNGCYYENITFKRYDNGNIMTSYPDSWTSGHPERGYIQNAFCKRGYYMAGFNQNVYTIPNDTTYRSYQLLCCPFITPPATS